MSGAPRRGGAVLRIACAAGLVAGLACVGEAEPEAWSLDGEPLARPALPDDLRRQREQQLEEARERAASRPDDPEALIWLGRRTAYLGRYREAIDLYGAGIARWPERAEFYRHRGHRWITVRRLDRAVEDLERATRLIEGVPDRIEPDGLPNPHNIPRSTSHSNIWYHLGLAYYLQGDFDNARRSYLECLEFSTNADMLSATSHWLYMTLRRMGRAEEAAALLEPIDEEMEILENNAYHELLLMYKGERSAPKLLARAESGGDGLNLATVGYGVGNWHLYGGRADEARDVFQRVVQAEQWAAFGHIAAEAELSRGVVR
jgi:tetratricopeptide (TPR) repeat protein